MSDDSVLLLASHDYLNYSAVLAIVSGIPPTSTLHVASDRTGIGHVISFAEHTPNVEVVTWQPTRCTQTCKSSRAILFWDGADRRYILRSLVVIRKANVPVDIYDTSGNLLDLPTFCARLTHNGGKMPQPSVIVDAPAIAPGESAKRDSKVRIQLHIPESTYDSYSAQAAAAKLAVEKICSDRLRTCVTHTSGRGLYFTDAERSDLERITGGHLISDAPTALQRIKTTVTLRVGDISVELTDRVLQRASSRAKSVRKSLEEYVRKEVIEGLERSVGIRPW